MTNAPPPGALPVRSSEASPYNCLRRARVLASPSSSPPGAPVRGEPGAVVLHHHVQCIADSLRADADDAGRGALADAVADGVLDDGLQGHVRHGRVEQLGIHVDVDAQPVGEAQLLDG